MFILVNNAISGKTMENLRKHRNIKLVTKERRRNDLVSEPHNQTENFFTEHFLATEMRKTPILMNKYVYLGLSVSYLSKTVMYEFLRIWGTCKSLLDGYRQLYCSYKNR